MESDDLRHVIPRKRSLSMTPDPEPAPPLGRPAKRAIPDARGPAAKRAKPTYDPALDEHVRGTLGTANPLGRKAVKGSLKKERKAARRAARAQGQGMVVDDVGEAVEFTFRPPGAEVDL